MAIKDDELARAIRNPWWRAAAILAVIAVAATAVLGGFRETRGKLMAKPPFAAGHRVDAGAMAITPLRAWIALKNPAGTANSFRPEQYLVLQARIENLTDTGYGAYIHLKDDVVLFADGIVADGIAPPAAKKASGSGPETLNADTLMRADDHTFSVALPPRLPVDVDLVWKLPPDHIVPKTLTWGVVGRNFVEQTFLTRESGWLPDRGKARWRLAVEDRRMAERAP